MRYSASTLVVNYSQVQGQTSRNTIKRFFFFFKLTALKLMIKKLIGWNFPAKKFVGGDFIGREFSEGEFSKCGIFPMENFP